MHSHERLLVHNAKRDYRKILDYSELPDVTSSACVHIHSRHRFNVQKVNCDVYLQTLASSNCKLGRRTNKTLFETFNCQLPSAVGRLVGNGIGKLFYHWRLKDADADLVKVNWWFSSKLHNSFCHCVRYVSRRHAHLTYKPHTFTLQKPFIRYDDSCACTENYC